MRTFLYTWNPQKWNPQFAAECKREIGEHGAVAYKWLSGRKDVSVGDRVFMIRLGAEPRGIFGSGRITGEAHLNVDAQVVPIDLDVIQNIDEGDAYIRMDELKELGEMNWSPQRGGAEIPSEIALKVEEIWVGIVGNSNLATEISGFDQELVLTVNELVQQGKPAELAGLEGGRRSVTVTRVERNPANRQACLNHWGYKCRVCDFDFGQAFGSVAEEFIHVHHHNLVAASGEIIPDPINDMSPLCPNCHAVAHLKRPPYTILELKEMRASSKSRS